MNKLLILFMFVFVHAFSSAQNVYFTRTGHIYFISQTDVIDIDANNNQVASFFDIETGKLQFAVLVKSFEFSLATAKEHFNESYMESDKFPKATFKGKIIDIEEIDLKAPGIYQVDVTGDLSVRGITKTIEVPAEVQVANNTISAKSEFVLTIADFNIKVPKVVQHRVAKQVTVNVNMDYAPYKK